MKNPLDRCRRRKHTIIVEVRFFSTRNQSAVFEGRNDVAVSAPMPPSTVPNRQQFEPSVSLSSNHLLTWHCTCRTIHRPKPPLGFNPGKPHQAHGIELNHQCRYRIQTGSDLSLLLPPHHHLNHQARVLDSGVDCSAINVIVRLHRQKVAMECWFYPKQWLQHPMPHRQWSHSSTQATGAWNEYQWFEAIQWWPNFPSRSSANRVAVPNLPH